MKTQIRKTIAAIILMTPIMLFAQTRDERAPRGERIAEVLELTDDQKTQIEGIHSAQMKESLHLRNQQNELRAKLQTLRTEESADMKAINNTIDDMTALQASLMKLREESHQKVRSLLTDEQRIKFDTMRSMRRERASRRGEGYQRRGSRGPRGEK